MEQSKLLDRCEGIGGSDAGVIMGVWPPEWKTPLQLYEEKAYKKVIERDNSAMKWGRDNEDVARAAFEKEFGVIVFPDHKVHPTLTWCRGNMDGIDLDRQVLVEIKNPGWEDHQEAMNGKVPEKYYPQCQHYLLLEGLPKMYYWSFYDGEGVAVVVERNEEYLIRYIQAVGEFLDRVRDKIPPEPCAHDKLDMKKNPVWQAKEEELATTRRLIKELQAEEEAIKEELIAQTGGRSATGSILEMTKSDVKGAVDYKRAASDYLENLRGHYPQLEFKDIPFDSYRKESFTKWTIRNIA